MTDPTPDQINALPPNAFWTEARARVAENCTVVKVETTAKRRTKVVRGCAALAALSLSSITLADHERVHRVETALEVLDEEQALLRVENERLRKALTAALPILGEYQHDGEVDVWDLARAALASMGEEGKNDA